MRGSTHGSPALYDGPHSAPSGGRGVLHCALSGEPPLPGIWVVGQFHANQGQLPPSKEMPVCPWFYFLSQSTLAEWVMMITSIQLFFLERHTDIDGALASVGAQLKVVPALCDAGAPGAAHHLLRSLPYAPCFRAHRILGTHKCLLGRPQIPFGAPTNAQKCIFSLSDQLSTQ